MKKFMQILLASFGVMALMFAGCETAAPEGDEDMGEEPVVEEPVEAPAEDTADVEVAE
ncbi:hypothetical protein HOD30_04815 [Candidatus Peregrinibacteria bacterium]|jgi:hypothetical protein|nr:hypothetical protein [Candidatus Peregrinibacteria bacterium]MBT4631740.1 hypothetical protein [Candidatus Peregrinibacteria bacterium]MBT5517250.1 hypothetical protein [Candidatus Peregrinibacteria bacterium]MBT5824535.1 hypothetical protein [Candidatus Peregrinibacteria bacterium]